MTDGDQQQTNNHKTPSNEEVVKYQSVSHGFKNCQYRPAENHKNQAGNESLKFELAKEYFERLHGASPFSAGSTTYRFILSSIQFTANMKGRYFRHRQVGEQVAALENKTQMAPLEAAHASGRKLLNHCVKQSVHAVPF